MAVVILPLLPPRTIRTTRWDSPASALALCPLVLRTEFCGLSGTAGSRQRGYSVAGLIGGFISSKGVAFTFARTSRENPAASFPLALGVVAAGMLMSLRVILATAILSPPLAVALIPYLIAPLLLGLNIVVYGFNRHQEDTSVELPSNPLQVSSALQMALLFQLVLFALYAVRSHWGDLGLLLSGAVPGFTDVDALTISMAKSADGQIPLAVAAEAVAIGVLSTTILKLLLGLVLGKARFRKLASAWVSLIAFASAVSLAVLH